MSQTRYYLRNFLTLKVSPKLYNPTDNNAYLIIVCGWISYSLCIFYNFQISAANTLIILQRPELQFWKVSYKNIEIESC